MGLKSVEVTVWPILQRTASSRVFPFIVGAIACVLTITMSGLALVPVLIGAILLRRDRWFTIAVLVGFGSALGSFLLFLAFRYLGWSPIVALYPDIITSRLSSMTSRWVPSYGTWSLLVVAALPLPQMPALILTAISELPASEVIIALLCGRLVKFTLYGWLAVRFPDWIRRLANSRVHRFGQIDTMAQPVSKPPGQDCANRKSRSGWHRRWVWKTREEHD